VIKQTLAMAVSVLLLGAAHAVPQAAPAGDPQTIASAIADDRRQLSFGSQRFDPTISSAYRQGTRTAAGAALRLVQFDDTPCQEWRDSLQQSGYRVIQYYPHNAYLVWGDDSAASATEAMPFVRWQGAVSPDWKLAPDLKGRLGPIDNVQMLVYDDGNLSNVLAQIEGFGARVLNTFDAQPDGALKSVILKVDAGLLAQIHALPQVLWSEYSGPRPIFDDEMSGQIVAGNYNASNVVTAPGYIASIGSLGLTGDGVVWAVTDSGIDYANPELSARIVAGHDFPGCPVTASQPGNDNASGGHGTHVAGIIAGAGVVAGGVDANGYHYGIGIAPQADLVALNPICVGAVPWPPAGGWQENSKQAILRNAVGTNNSWTSAEGTNIGYNATARQHDFMVRDGNFDTPTVNDQFMIVFSAGNSGPGASSLTSPKEAKNPIIVAATRNQRVGSIEDLASFSSRGPAVDGRVLPTIGAPGEQIASTRRVAGASQCGTAIGAAPLNNYAFCSGTSMAAPQVSGTAALLTQWWRDNNGGATPSPAMIKALLVNSAVDMSGVAQAVPNNNEGWGRIQLRNAIGEGRSTERIDQANRLDAVGEVFERSYGVPNGAQPVRITLAWTDAPGAAGANPALVNNLDLVVIADGQTYLGNVLGNGQSTPGGSADNRNPVENVFLPAGTGAVTVRVIATTLPGDGVPNVGDATDQDFALVCSNCAAEPGFTVSMPTGMQSVCGNAQIQRPITIGTILGFTDSVTMSSTGLPAPGTVGFSPNPITPPGSSTMTVDTTGVAAGEYTLLATGTSGAIVRSSSFPLFLATQAPAASTLTTPANSATNVPPATQFTWAAAAQAFDYVVEIATDAAFANIVRSTTTRGTSWTPSPALDTNTAYFWRVISRNACPTAELFADGFEGGGASGGGVASPTSTFTTQAAPGDCPVGPAPTIVASEDFEGAASGWIQEAGGTGANSWAISSAFPFAGTKALRGITPATASDQRFISPVFALPAVGNGLTLSFQSRQQMEPRGGGCWDGGFIEVAVNGGAYTQITAGLLTDPYQGPLGSGNPAAPAAAWCGDPQPYLKSVIDLAPYAGQNVRFRFRIASDTSEARAEGWNIDNVEIKRCN
jgi:subtilisin family serine protease